MGRVRVATLTILTALFAISGGALAQTDEQLANLPLQSRFGLLITQGRYLEALRQYEAAEPAEAEEARPSYEQYRPTLDGFFVPDEGSLPLPAVDRGDLDAYDGAIASDAIAEIVERARATRIVIVNEAHDSPRDRAFILEVAEALKPLGFTHYAAETFVNQTPEMASAAMDRLKAEGYPVQSTGTYTSDPMFSFLVRRAMVLGYSPVSYEIPFTPELMAASPEESIELREQAQAENLARVIAAAGPEAKFLIHVGYGHAVEFPPPGASEWMAARLARLTGLDPLTVDQTGVSEVAPVPRGRVLHAALASRVGERSAIFMKNGAPLASGRMGAGTDLQVVHPLVTVVDGRPGWLRETERIAVAIPERLLPSQGRRLVQAFVAGEAADAVPLDQALVTAGLDPPVLYVPRDAEIRWAVQE